MTKYPHISDMFKDAHGFRPSSEWLRAFAASPEVEQTAEVDSLAREIEASIERDRQANERAVIDYERRIEKNMEFGAPDRDTAKRWLLEAEGLDKEFDPGYVAYCLGLHYSLEAEFRDFVSSPPWFEEV